MGSRPFSGTRDFSVLHHPWHKGGSQVPQMPQHWRVRVRWLLCRGPRIPGCSWGSTWLASGRGRGGCHRRRGAGEGVWRGQRLVGAWTLPMKPVRARRGRGRSLSGTKRQRPPPGRKGSQPGHPHSRLLEVTSAQKGNDNTRGVQGKSGGKAEQISESWVSRTGPRSPKATMWVLPGSWLLMAGYPPPVLRSPGRCPVTVREAETIIPALCCKGCR